MVGTKKLEEAVRKLWKEEAKKNATILGMPEEELSVEVSAREAKKAGDLSVQFKNFGFAYVSQRGDMEGPVLYVPYDALFRGLKTISNSLRHEVRHGIVDKVRQYVIRENPIEFMRYFDGTLGNWMPSPDTRQLMPREMHEEIISVKSVERTDAGGIRTRARTILRLYDRIATVYVPHHRGMEETFAEDSREVKELAEQLQTCIKIGATITPAYMVSSIVAMSLGEVKWGIFIGVGGLITSAITLYAFVHRDRYIPPEDFDLTTKTLKQMPKPSRKYLITMPPTQGTIPEHLEKLKAYGFDITK